MRTSVRHRSFSRGLAIALAAAFVVLSLARSAGATSVSEIMKNPAVFDHKTVSVSGTAEAFHDEIQASLVEPAQ